MHPDAPANSAASSPPAGMLVVTVDRLPAWMLPAFGATWVATPAIDALAARGLVFDRVITPAADSVATLHDLAFAGETGCAGGTGGPSPIQAAIARGWKPVLVTDDAAAADQLAPCGMEKVLVAAATKAAEAADDAATEVARLVDAAVDLLRAGGHRLVWCHVASLGVAWDAPRKHRERYVDPEDPPPPAGAGVPSFAVDADTDPDLLVGMRQVFAGQLSLLDAQLGRLFEFVAAADWTVLLAGVRGMPLGLHGWVGVGGPDDAHGELVHVPAILVDAGGRMAAQRFGGLVVPADLGATLAELVAGEPAGQPPRDPAAPWRGASLAGLLRDWSAMPRDRVVVVAGNSVAIVTPSWHCLSTRGDAAPAGGRRVRLFAKPDDFFECNDVADRCPAVTEPLADLLAREAHGDGRALWLARLPEAPPA
jgi:arylsulfatase A-like enzyme